MNKPRPKLKNILYLSDKRTLFVGRLQEPLQLQHSAASSFLVSAGPELELIDHLNGKSYRGKSFLIPVGTKVGIDTRNSIFAYGFLDAHGTDVATLIPRMKETFVIDNNTTLYSGIFNESTVINQVQYVWNKRPTAKEIFELGDTWIGPVLPGTVILADDRVTKAILLIKEHYANNTSVSDIAKQVNLSEPRLMQLFKQIVGISIRRYRLWHRIYATAVKMASGFSETEAALDAGFSDCAQFSRAFKEIGGAKPSDILTIASNTEIHILPTND